MNTASCFPCAGGSASACAHAALALLVGLLLGLPSGATAATPAASAPVAVTAVGAAASGAAPTHRPLRENQPPATPEPTEPRSFNGYPDAPAFSVVARKPQLALYPCSQCHKVLPLNTQPRKLVAAPHAAALPHGNGRFWCLDCHQGNDRDVLHTIGGAKVDFDQSYLLCGQCHSARQRDWFFGAHGKRVAGWQGDRQLYSCTHCHDPHNPVIAPRQASKPPPVRAGLAPMVRVHDSPTMPWQKNAAGADHAPAPKP
jgi:hypothetical protein